MTNSFQFKMADSALNDITQSVTLRGVQYLATLPKPNIRYNPITNMYTAQISVPNVIGSVTARLKASQSGWLFFRSYEGSAELEARVDNQIITRPLRLPAKEIYHQLHYLYEQIQL